MPAPLPTIFVSHGAPTLSLDPGATGAAWRELARSFERPHAIVCVSAHWDTARPAVSAALEPETIHDFFGFPQPLFEIEYPARGDAQLAKRVCELLAARNVGVEPRGDAATDRGQWHRKPSEHEDSERGLFFEHAGSERGLLSDLESRGLTVDVDSERGLDHGAWVPLRYMYPDGDVPVIQLAVQSNLGAEYHARVGRALRQLPHEGVLVLASGSATHNLSDVDWRAPENRATQDYVPRFLRWLHGHLVASDVDALIDYRRRCSDGVRAHPTEDHFVPLFVALGAAGDEPRVERAHTGITHGVLGMDVYTFRPRGSGLA